MSLSFLTPKPTVSLPDFSGNWFSEPQEVDGGEGEKGRRETEGKGGETGIERSLLEWLASALEFHHSPFQALVITGIFFKSHVFKSLGKVVESVLKVYSNLPSMFYFLI